jgi:hypothetical protein
MSKVKKIIDLLEKNGELLYHNTSYTGLMSIIKNNELGTTSTVSLTRDKDYDFYEFKEQIVLDGKKLRSKYKISSYVDPGMITSGGNPDPESEERVYNGPIKQVDKYILSIRLSDKSKVKIKNELQASKQWIKRYDTDSDFRDNMKSLTQIDDGGGNMFSGFTKESYQRYTDLLEKILNLSKK